MTDGYYDSFLWHPDPARRVGWTNTLEQAVRFEVVRAIIQPSDTLVDLGCGSGALLAYLRKCGWEGHYSGVDIYPHPFLDDENASWSRQDFTTIETLDADVVVALGSMVGNSTPTAFAGILRLLQQGRRGFVFAGVHPRWLRVVHDPALTVADESEVQRCIQQGATVVPMLESDLCLIGGSLGDHNVLTHQELFEHARQRCESTPGEQARVAFSLGLGDEIIALNQSHPQDEEVQLAHERWINKLFSLA